MLMNIWVRDKHSGEVHQVGTNQHDSLDTMHGVVNYYNLQNGDGTGEGGGYEFVEAPDMDDYVNVTPEEMYLNKAYLDDRLYQMLQDPEYVKQRKERSDEIIAKAKAIREKNKGFFTLS